MNGLRYNKRCARSTSSTGSTDTCRRCSFCDHHHHSTSCFTYHYRNTTAPDTTTSTRQRQLFFNLCQCTMREEERNIFTIHSNPLAMTSHDSNNVGLHPPIPLIDEVDSSRMRKRSLISVASRQISNSSTSSLSPSTRTSLVKPKRLSSFRKPNITAINMYSGTSGTACVSSVGSTTNSTSGVRNARGGSGITGKQTMWKQQEKAFRQLILIVLGFMCCFLPYFILYMVVAFCGNCISNRLITMSTWLGYANSTINPFLYALSNEHFRRTFNRILKRDQRRQSYYN
ncbi:unnamed protein product [Didymodactylos carnosus]|nr:unnamed protein product [Didymodactylos carnosus]CAF4406486.1 unnamed protein product [Didymodactylos carnosus]